MVIALENVFFYFGEYRSHYYFEDSSGEFAMEAGQHLNQLGPYFALRVLGAPRVFAEFPTLSYLAPDHDIANLRAEELETFTLPVDQGVLFAAIPENVSVLDVIEDRYPGGTRESVIRKSKNEVLYYAYILPPDG
jgi:hypothetical protein